MVKIYTSNWCGYCSAAKNLLDKLAIEYEEINIEELGMSREDLGELTGGMTVPQIVINNQSIGGYEDLLQLNQSGKLKELLKKWNLFQVKY